MNNRLKKSISKLNKTLSEVQVRVKNAPPGPTTRQCKCNRNDAAITAWDGQCKAAAYRDTNNLADGVLHKRVLKDNCPKEGSCRNGNCLFHVECINRKNHKRYFSKKIQTVNGCLDK